MFNVSHKSRSESLICVFGRLSKPVSRVSIQGKKPRLCWAAGSSSSLSSRPSFHSDRGSALRKMWLNLYISLWQDFADGLSVRSLFISPSETCCVCKPTSPCYSHKQGVLSTGARQRSGLWICWQITIINKDQGILSGAVLILFH